MEKFKIENFERERGEGSFPLFRSFTGSELTGVYMSLMKRLALPESTSRSSLDRKIYAASKIIGEIDLDNISATFLAIVFKLGMDSSRLVYLNWGRDEELDEIKFEDLLSNFDDIWYPHADDFDIIDQDLNWVISVDHDGMVRLLQLKKTHSHPTSWG
jgi:hypothetical protein